MSNNPPATISRHDYTAPSYWVNTVEMGFDLDQSATRVATRITMQRNTASPNKDVELLGEEIKLVALRMNGKLLNKGGYTITGGKLRIANAPDEITLEIETLINPEKNTTMMGLYISNGNFFTQCEAEGFRKITYFPDRPDVMAKYTVMLRGDKQKYPVLLSNGNLVEQGDLPRGRHYAKWEDPFKKPSYLFALVAGKLVCQEEKFKLASGRKALLQVWVEPGNLDKTQHAMESLKHSIRWDQQRFGLELDLDRFMIVAVSDFNMGAMENKGLNIFNTKYVLANPSIATDVDYANIEAVVGHEYFHNWTGNRVTCRDWFQLSLKEGLTVFRDQEFSADMVGTPSGRAVKRIDDVRVLRQVQFSEDAGPMAHPVRPDYYVEINNFYTVTIYEKGAEVVRMYQTLLGRDGFRKGMDLYFQRHDGHAVTCDDFRAAMADSSGRDLSQFERWYSQSGTPQLQVKSQYDADKQTFELTLSQTCKPTAGQECKLPFHIPVAVGLLDAQGADMPLHLQGAAFATSVPTTCVLELTKEKQTFVFTDVTRKPTPSLLRNFSAPVELEYGYTDAELAHLMAHDSDAFNRWEAGQRLAINRIFNIINDLQNSKQPALDELFINAMRTTLNDQSLDPSFREVVLTLPSELMLAEQCEVIDPQAIHAARKFMRNTLSEKLKADFIAAYEANQTPGKYSADAKSAGKRGLKNLCLSYLLGWEDDSTLQLAHAQVDAADNMTDRLAALMGLINSGSPSAEQPLHKFYKDFKNEALVVDKWFSLQAVAEATDVKTVRKLMSHPAFTLKNPNRARSLIFSFCNGNPAQFHALDGSGYAFWAEQVLALNKLNPQVAARLVRTLDHWKKYKPALKKQMQAALQKVAATKGLSKDVHELVTKALT
ncbi:MAG: aminopeptidase N [Gallionellales bacterium 35-53-114]|jgi:aminopeptidase N|nr:MAG: aminopeptidase N [Gallionellales bacterium 35-53-114]OYZ64653.1 MAG: aminopeptidase N [Gallionellales bacterium 24-53-125]OZB07808.1 MAG: aminopeptidase N [Gallionellales bacterium 39-52-133]HQS58477.1 aminopeptidase N [Gallionellaceae bacterium]HQS74818.1 aminopeptidase N [Gallionellaceae bacterium]